MDFSRHISSELIDKLNDLFDHPEFVWWRSLISDPEIFIAIRKDVVHAYYRGCRLAEIALGGQNVHAKTHYKYLLRPDVRPEYIQARSGRFEYPATWREEIGSVFVGDLSETAAMKRAAKPYGGDEKAFVSDLIRKHSNIIDVEIAMSQQAEKDETKGPSALRIDLATVRYSGADLSLQMYEVKLFGNPELRAQGDDVPVLNQIARYEKLLDEYNLHLRNSYLTSARNVIALRGIPEQRKQWARKIIEAESGFSISREPILIIGGFDADQKRGDAWLPHIEKLEKRLGRARIIARGNARSVDLSPGQPSEVPTV